MSSHTSVPSEMSFFSALMGAGSFSSAAIEMGISTPAVSKRLAQLEVRLGVRLLNRTSRRIGLTPEGEIYLDHARRILAEIDDMERLLTKSSEAPKGLLRVNATLGFGRNHVAPLISKFVKLYPEVRAQLQLTVNPPPITDDAFDVCIRFGEPPDTRLIARKIAANRRLLCAAPSYLKLHGTPKVPHDLTKHNCILIRQGNEAYGTWHLSSGNRNETLKVRGNLSTNDGEIAVNWALAGHGILKRAEWDVDKYLRSGRLLQLLENWQTTSADIYAVYPQGLHTAARVRSFVEFVVDAWRQLR
jgi:LysR family transcriptional activator of dmlA